MRFYLACLLCLSIVLVAHTTSAQDAEDAAQPSADAAEAARTLFEEGLALADADRWGEAAEKFAASLRLVDRASTQFNYANALVRSGRFVEARDVLRGYSVRSEIVADPARLEAARALLERVEGSLAHLVVRVEPSSATVSLDGAPRPEHGAVRLFPIDPGPRRLRVSAEGYQPHDEAFDAQAGESLERGIELALVGEEPRPLRRSPVLWSVVAGVVVAAVVVGVVVSQTGGQSVYGGTTGVVLPTPSP